MRDARLSEAGDMARPSKAVAGRTKEMGATTLEVSVGLSSLGSVRYSPPMLSRSNLTQGPGVSFINGCRVQRQLQGNKVHIDDDMP